jgi:hypothetical protein
VIGGRIPYFAGYETSVFMSYLQIGAFHDKHCIEYPKVLTLAYVWIVNQWKIKIPKSFDRKDPIKYENMELLHGVGIPSSGRTVG